MGKNKIYPFVVDSCKFVRMRAFIRFHGHFFFRCKNIVKHRKKSDSDYIGRCQTGGDGKCLIGKYCSRYAAHENQRNKDSDCCQR